jgi:hypothetical protein
MTFNEFKTQNIKQAVAKANQIYGYPQGMVG